MHWSCNLVLGIKLLLLGSMLSAQPLVSETSFDQIDQLNDHAWELARTLPDSAESVAKEAIRLSESVDNYPKGLINAHVLLGILNKDRGYYGISVEHYLTAMELAEKEEDFLRVSGCLNNLGSVYAEKEEHHEALSYFQQSLSLEEEYGDDPEQLSIRLFNIGEAYLKLDSLDEAAAYYYNSLLIEEKAENKEGIFYARLGIGKVDLKTGNLPKATQELGKALELALQLNNHPGICETRLALGELQLTQGAYQASAEQFELALERAQKYGYKGLESGAVLGLSQLHRQQKKFEKAISLLDQYYDLQGELNDSRVNNRIGELRTRYELKKKEQEIELLHQKDLVSANEVKYERKLRNYLLFMVALVVLLTLYNIWRSRQAKGARDV